MTCHKLNGNRTSNGLVSAAAMFLAILDKYKRAAQPTHTVAHRRYPQQTNYCLSDILHIGRLQPRFSTAEHRKYGHVTIMTAERRFAVRIKLAVRGSHPDEPIRYVKNDAINSAVETLTTLSTEPWTLQRIVSRMGLGSRNPAIVGSAEEVAEDLISWVDQTPSTASTSAAS